MLASAAACAAPAAATPDSAPGTIDARTAGDSRPGAIDARGAADAAPPPSSGITVIVEPNGNAASEVIASIDAATSSVYMTMYQIDDTRVTDALVAREHAGLDVQVILDGSTTNKSWNTPAYDQLAAAGVAVVWSSAAFTYTHEKTVIIDGDEAWIMTMNFNNSSPKYNREYLAHDTNAADVDEATAVFVADHARQAITPTGPLVVANTNARARLVALIDGATTTLDVEGEEFSDTYSTGVVAAVVRAAKRGVAVRVVIANDTLSSSASTAAASVKAAGGKVVMTGPTSGNGTAQSPYIHAKAIVVDCAGTTCARGFVGSENFTAGSLGYNRELGVELSSATELAKIEAAIATDFAAGKPL